jgi:hypothetical protein
MTNPSYLNTAAICCPLLFDDCRLQPCLAAANWDMDAAMEAIHHARSLVFSHCCCVLPCRLTTVNCSPA